jgi:hypothetical protein
MNNDKLNVFFKPDGRLLPRVWQRPVVIQANYHANRQDKHLIDDVIAGWTGIFPCNWGTPPLSHTEIGLVFGDEIWFFSATSRPELGTEKLNGTRWIKAESLLRNINRWSFQIKKLDFVEAWLRGIRANRLIGMRYDYVGVVADFILPVDLAKVKNVIYCSKAVYYTHTGEHKRISPRRIWKWANNNGFLDIGRVESVQELKDNVREIEK